MADDGRRQQGNLSPIGGAAMRQIRGRDHSAYNRPPPQSSHHTEESPNTWTQFSGMPHHPVTVSSSPGTTLPHWLHSGDDFSLNSDTTSGFHSFSTPSSTDSRGSPLSSFSNMDFLGSSLNSGVGHGGPSSSLGQFDFSTLPDYGLPSDFHMPLSSSRFVSPTSGGQLSPPAADLTIPPPANFSQPPPDFTFHGHLHPDFSRPPPSFMPEIPPFSPPPATDVLSQGLPELFPAHAKRPFANSHTHGGNFHTDNRLNLHSHLGGFDSMDCVPDTHDAGPGHIDVSLPPPSFPHYSVVADDILFPTSGLVDGHDLGKVQDFEHISPPHQKLLRQSSEPMYRGTTAEEGQAMYVEALRRLNSFGPSGPSYEPFGSSIQMQDEMLETASTMSDEAPISRPILRSEPPKMSYSDAAKAAKSKSAQAKSEASCSDRVEPDLTPSRLTMETTLPPRFQRQAVTKRQSSHPRSSSQRGKAADALSANSRYGLDQFEDLSDLVHGDGHSSSMENLSQPHVVARRNSNSSMSSGHSAVDDILFPKATGSGDGRSRLRDVKSLQANGKDGAHDHSIYNPGSVSNSAFSEQQAKANSPSSPSNVSSPKVKSEKLFFDPKRIFQSRGGIGDGKTQDKTRVSEDGKRSDKGSRDKEETVLNNGKPNNTTSKATAATQRKADYINNDLREATSTPHPSTSSSGSSGSGSGGSSKRTNQTAAFGRHGHSSKKQSGKDGAGNNGGSSSERARVGDSRGRGRNSEAQEDNSIIRNIDWDLVDEWMKYISDCSMSFARNSFSAVLTLLLYLLGIFMYLALGAIHLIVLGVSKVWSLIRTRFFKDQGPGPWGGFSVPGAEPTRRRFGLEENIALPSTGEEAMKRLLACKGKDPYSILGLKADATDEEIKRYYKRQAVLVHPDKNQEPGAEEAFKILGHAFEKIGDATKRKEYDTHIFEASEAEAAMREFSDLLTKLQEKVQEAANLMRCDHCGGKHRRIPVDRPWYSARFCDRCSMHHTAKEGDVWAESSMLGFLWHYYACMENNVYDITEWVSCQRENFKHMKANAHPVFYRIQTDGNRRHRQGQSGEADLEDFINRLFSKAQESGNGSSPYSGWQFSNQGTGSPGAGGAAPPSGWGSTASAANAAAGSSTKRSRRKKKRN